MPTATLRFVGGSVMVAIPTSLLESVRLSPGQKVELRVAHGRLIIEPHKKPRCVLADLLAQCDPEVEYAEEPEWQDDEAVGREML